MRKTFAALAVAALSLAGCGATGEDDTAVTSTPVVTSTSTTSATSSTNPTSSTTAQPPAEVTVEQPAAQPVPLEQPAAPTFVRCEMQNGTALMSDGTTTYLESCDENAGGMVPGNAPPTYSAEEEARNKAQRDWYDACVEEHGIDYCVEEMNS